MNTTNTTNMNPRHATRWALALAALASATTSTPALAQHDHTPAEEQAIRAALGPVGQARFYGSQGVLDYEHVTPVSRRALPALWTPLAAEPENALRPYQSRGARVAIDWNLLAQVHAGRETRVALPLFDGEVWELAFVALEQRTPTNYTWFGQVAGVATSDFILVRYEDVIHLTVRDYERKKTYEVYSVPDENGRSIGHTLRKFADVRMPDGCGTCRQGAPIPPFELPAPNNDNGSGGPYSDRTVVDPADRIDVFFVCSNQARAQLGDSGFYSLAQACVDQANIRNNNSGTGLNFRVMAADPGVANYDESSDGGTDLVRLATPGDGFMDAVLPARDLYRADLVAMFRVSGWGSGTIGVGYRPSNTGQLNPGSGFTVTSLQGDIGNTFSHEAGHNMGACHDPSVGGGCGGGTAITGSPFGYIRVCDTIFCNLRWHTTMSYQTVTSCDTSTPIPFYSNPNVNFDPPGACNSQPIGDGASNVANMFQTTRGTVSQYRIGNAQTWAWGPSGGGGNGTRFSPFGRMANAVATVQGGAAEGRVMVFGSTLDDTAAAGGPVLLSNPCVIQSADNVPALIR